jgi:FtsH-binding integral membrane protein
VSLFFCAKIQASQSGGLMYWMTLVLGIWVFISPWLLNFSTNAAALWSNLLTGLVLVILSIYGLTISENN